MANTDWLREHKHTLTRVIAIYLRKRRYKNVQDSEEFEISEFEIERFYCNNYLRKVTLLFVTAQPLKCNLDTLQVRPVNLVEKVPIMQALTAFAPKFTSQVMEKMSK